MSVWCYSLLERTKFSKISPVENKDKIPSNPCGFFYNRCNGAPAWAYVSSTFEIQTDSKRVRNSLRMLSPVTAIIKSAWFSVILSALFTKYLPAVFRSSTSQFFWEVPHLLHCQKIRKMPRPFITAPLQKLFSLHLPFFFSSLSFEWNKIHLKYGPKAKNKRKTKGFHSSNNKGVQPMWITDSGNLFPRVSLKLGRNWDLGLSPVPLL